MSSLPPENLPAPPGGQPEAFSAAPPPATPSSKPQPEIDLRPTFDIQPPLLPVRADARTPFRWADLLYLLIFYLVGGGVIFFVVASAAFLFFGVRPSELRESALNSAPVVIVTQALLSAATLGFLYVMLRGRSAAPFWEALGWRRFKKTDSSRSLIWRYVFGGFALAVAAGLLGSVIGRESDVPMEKLMRSPQSVLMLMGLGILVAPIFEETIFRGCIYPVIARRFGISTGIVATGTLFGLAHAQQLGFAWGPVALIIMVGIILTYIRARAGTVAASYLVHLGYNGALFLNFLIFTGGLRHLPGA